MHVDSTTQPCPRCVGPTVLVTDRSGRRWLHVGTWQPHCGQPSWVRASEHSATPAGAR
ncbi:hypothetical protein G443_000634 [Actinoalloteichus cyanogriseus DSM 43889]|uniref:Uncharacterized protein n=1 Tax=Actinoalloteichus caeruleus DSM 43889 TaxID=1120930 RepID=A0ABT1JDK4_ACTCY|nr:hypothetical protein [Actinoalloteichus caeruleus DSM 43889]